LIANSLSPICSAPVCSARPPEIGNQTYIFLLTLWPQQTVELLMFVLTPADDLRCVWFIYPIWYINHAITINTTLSLTHEHAFIYVHNMFRPEWPSLNMVAYCNTFYIFQFF
jgi:hypothetical protein